MFNWQIAKRNARRIVHKTFAVVAFYQGKSMSTPVEITARYHSKTAKLGDLDNSNYAVTIEGVDRVIFSAQQARELGMTRGDAVWFPDVGAGLGAQLGSPLGGEGIGPPKFLLSVRDPDAGPEEEVWEVTRK